MNALIAEVSATIVPKPVPIVVESLAMDWLLRRRAEPQVVIHSLGYWHIPRNLADACTRLIAEAAGERHLAYFAGVNVLHRLLAGLRGARLRAGLADLAGFA